MRRTSTMSSSTTGVMAVTGTRTSTAAPAVQRVPPVVRGRPTNSGEVTNGGHIELGGGTTWLNQGPYTQAATGITTGASMTNNNTVTGLGTPVHRDDRDAGDVQRTSTPSDRLPGHHPTRAQTFDVENRTIHERRGRHRGRVRRRRPAVRLCGATLVTADLSVTATARPRSLRAGGSPVRHHR